MDPDRLTNLRLVKIGDIKGINALAPRKALEFGKSNLTVIYGHNGSGKSGYVRLLKHMCGARSPGTIHADVFSAAPQVRGCSVCFELEGQIRSLTWQIGQESIEELRGVDIFDVDTARTYDSECEVAYEPPVLAHLTDLANVCDRVSAELDHRVQGEKSLLPKLPPAHEKTIAGQWYQNLSSTTTEAEVSERCTWTSTDEGALTALKARIGEQDPTQHARELRGQVAHTQRGWRKSWRVCVPHWMTSHAQTSTTYGRGVMSRLDRHALPRIERSLSLVPKSQLVLRYGTFSKVG
jgi:energy-coupling factor transporter ATP-binding protein EcfA2